MRRIHNYLAIFYGSLFIVSGILKYFKLLQTFKISFGGYFFEIPVSDSLFYIIAVNFIGGGSLVFHAIKTLNFSKSKKINITYIDDHASETSISNNPLSTSVSITGYITFLISFFLLIQTFIILGSFEGVMGEYLLLFLGTTAFFLPQSIIPGSLAIRNMILNTEFQNKARRKIRK